MPASLVPPVNRYNAASSTLMTQTAIDLPFVMATSLASFTASRWAIACHFLRLTSYFLLLAFHVRLFRHPLVVLDGVLQQIGDVLRQNISLRDQIERGGGVLADILVAIPVALFD